MWRGGRGIEAQSKHRKVKAGNTVRDAVESLLVPLVVVCVHHGVESDARSFEGVPLDSDWTLKRAVSILCTASLSFSVGHTVTRW